VVVQDRYFGLKKLQEETGKEERDNIKDLRGGSMNKEEKEFEKLSRNLPCLSCIIKPICFHPGGSTSRNAVKEPCQDLFSWLKKEKKYLHLGVVSRSKILNQVLEGAKRCG
jgi:hypothetical protein